MGKVSIDLSISNIWHCWHRFKHGKRQTQQLELFSYYLEKNLWHLHEDLMRGSYSHGGYTYFTVVDNKRRNIAVASIRDRIVHRLLYEYLTIVYDRTFIFDAWSCRKGKGLVGAIERAEQFLKRFPDSYVWRADITKFFDSMDHYLLITILCRKIQDHWALYLLDEVVNSYAVKYRLRGIPIGNLTSQIFANIYLNELDWFVKHTIKPLAYARYGDDFIIIAHDKRWLREVRQRVTSFLSAILKLEVNPRSDILIKATWGLHFLGVEIFPTGRRLTKKNKSRAEQRLTLSNVSSYRGLIRKHSTDKVMKYFTWKIIEKMEQSLYQYEP